MTSLGVHETITKQKLQKQLVVPQKYVNNNFFKIIF